MAKRRGTTTKTPKPVVRTTDTRREITTKVVSSRLSDPTSQRKAPISRDVRNTGVQQKQGVSASDARNQKKRDAQREPLKKPDCKPRPKSNKSKGGGSRRFAGRYC